MGQAGVQAVEPLVMDWVNWRVSGVSSGVAMVGVPASGLSALPVPPANASRSWASAVSVNARSGRTIGIEQPGDIAELGGRAVEVTSLLDDFASFLGGPYVFVDLAEAQQIQKLASDQANYLMVFADAGADVEQLTENLEQCCRTTTYSASAAFARRTSNFWLSRTGAGGGFLLTAALGFLIGVVVVSQTLYTSVVQRQREYAALSAIGASPTALPRVVMTEALMCGGAGGLAGLALTYPGVWALQRFVVPWIQVPAMLRVSSLVVAMGMAALAATVALRTVTRTDPATILRG